MTYNSKNASGDHAQSAKEDQANEDQVKRQKESMLKNEWQNQTNTTRKKKNGKKVNANC